ncbi:hypothetical protein GYB22_03365 [bacterium]|nr:hypothetical protein [bacterium]
MAKFLNRDNSVAAIAEIIKNAESEIVLIVPFIKVSPLLKGEIIEAGKNGKEIMLVYRENSMDHKQRQELYELDHLTILNHSNVHAKCYFNENQMIIGSMNLYGPTEKENREMGVLLSKNGWHSDDNLYYDALEEASAIIQTAQIEKKSQKQQDLKTFGFNLLKPKKDNYLHLSEIVNEVFENKKFELFENNNYVWLSCDPYLEKLSVDIEFGSENNELDENIRRVSLKPKIKEEELEQLYDIFWRKNAMNCIHGIDVYWSYYKSNITIYANKTVYPNWYREDFRKNIYILKDGMNKVINHLIEIMKYLRIRT